MAFLAPTNGSNTAPSYSFDGDNNTGMYQDGNGAVAFVSGSSEVFRIQGGRLLSVGGANASLGQSSPLSTVAFAVATGKIMMSGNTSTTAADENIFAFYRRPGTTPGTPLSSGENMGRIGWFGSSNDSDNANEGASLGAVAYPSTWVSGVNRIAAITGKVAGVEKARLNWDGSIMVGGTLPSSPNITLNSNGDIVTNLGRIVSFNQQFTTANDVWTQVFEVPVDSVWEVVGNRNRADEVYTSMAYFRVARGNNASSPVLATTPVQLTASPAPPSGTVGEVELRVNGNYVEFRRVNGAGGNRQTRLTAHRLA